MILSEKEVLQYLKRGETYKEHLRGRRHFLESESGEGAELRRLILEEEQYRLVMAAMWRIEPWERALLIQYYADRLNAHTIASEMNISDATFWRRRRSAFASLMRECCSVYGNCRGESAGLEEKET